MMKTLMIAGAALAAASVPTVANATTNIEGNTIQCSTSSSPNSGCNTTSPYAPPGLANAMATVVYGGAPEFFINVTPINGSANPLISVNFENGVFTLQGLGTIARQFSGTVLTFTNLTNRWSSFSATGVLAGRTTLLSNGGLAINLTGTSWSEATSGSVNVTAVPEPGTWMLMILGLGAVGFAMRRRQTVSARLQFA